MHGADLWQIWGKEGLVKRAPSKITRAQRRRMQVEYGDYVRILYLYTVSSLLRLESRCLSRRVGIIRSMFTTYEGRMASITRYGIFVSME